MARFLILTWFFLGPLVRAAERWNVVLLTAEGLRPDHLGCYGYARDTSPFLDSLAARGVRFDRAYAQAPWTAPALISLFTGLYPCAHGVDRRGNHLPPEAETIFKSLGRAGWNVPLASYLVEYSGFWNLGLGPAPTPDWDGRPVEAMLEAIRDRAPEPFVLWFHYKWTHLPYDAPAEDLAAFRSAPLPAGLGIAAVRTQDVIEHGSVVFREDERRAIVDLYDAEVHRFDRDLARLVRGLEERGVRDRTLLVVTADHGEELFEHGWIGHASTARRATLYEEVLRVPLVLSAPGLVPEGRVVRGPVRQVDVAPTLLDLLGVPVPGCVQGVSRLSAVVGDATIPATATYSESILGGFQTAPEGLDTLVRSALDGRWKLIWTRRPDRDRFELYDLLRDPGETRDLAGRRVCRLHRVKRLLYAHLADCGGVCTAAPQGREERNGGR